MSSDSLMRPGLPESAVRIGAKSVRIADLDIRSPEAMTVAREWFASGVRATKQDAYAQRIGVTASVLSEMVSGARKRQIHLVQALPLLEVLATAQAFVGWQCRLAHLIEPEPVDTITLSGDQAREVARVRDFLGETWKYAGESYASRFYGCSRDHLDAAIDAHLRMGK